MRKNCSDYPVEIVEGAFAEGNAVLADVLKKVAGVEKPRVMLVADQNVVNRIETLGKDIGRWVQANGIELAAPPVLASGGERVKSDGMQTAMEIAWSMLKAKVGTGDVVLAIGGGSLLDVACWAAAQLRGGVPVVRMPTTPAAMVDAAFSEYAAVLDAALTKKLVKLAGMYRDRDPAALREMVEATVATRTKKGGTDFAIWAAHRLEAMSCYRLPHGYAVVIGISIDTAYATMKGVMKETDRKTICDALSASGAMDGAVHSQHLLGRDELVLLGLDSWQLTNGTRAITLPAGIGKSEVEENPDRDTMKRAVNLLK